MATTVRSQPVTPTAAGAPAQQPWDLMLVSTAIYMSTAVARLHQLFKPIEALKPTLIFAVLGIIIYFLDKRPMRSWSRLKVDPVGRLAIFVTVWATIGVPFVPICD